MNRVEAGNLRPISELLLNCEISALASRIATAVADFFEILGRLIQEGFFQFTQLSNPNYENAKRFVTTILEFPPEERADALRYSLPLIVPTFFKPSLFGPEMDENARIQLIQVVAKNYLNTNGKLEKRLIPRLPSAICHQESIDILKTLGTVNANEREQVARLTGKVDKHGEGSIDYHATTIKIIKDLPVDERESTVLLIDRIINYGSAVLRQTILCELCEVDVNERDDLVRLSLQLMSPRMNNGVRHGLFLLVKSKPAHEREAYVRDRLAGVYRNEDARHGINVHEGTRDERTKTALEKLYAYREPLSAEEITSAKDEFIAYLATHPMDETQRTLAQDALFKPKENGESFGPLLDEEGFTLLGFKVDGAELMARLWLYALQLTEPEQTNAKEEMIFALQNSYDKHDHDLLRVCNQGKTQRLVIAVLQGRLPGVEIDRQPTVLSRDEALHSFFSVEAHRHIQARDALIAAANAFCDASPNVDKADFIVGIEAYATLQGLD